MYADSSNLSRLLANALSGAATATGLLGFAVAGILVSLQGREPVRVNTDSLAWWRSVEIQSERVSPEPVAPAPKVQLRQRNLMALRFGPQPRRKVRPRSDRIVQTQAAPQEVQPQEEHASPQDLLALRSVHQLLRSRFVAALNTQPKKVLVAQATTSKSIQQKSELPHQTPHNNPKKKPKASVAVAVTSALMQKESKAAPSEPEAQPVQKELAVVAPMPQLQAQAVIPQRPQKQVSKSLDRAPQMTIQLQPVKKADPIPQRTAVLPKKVVQTDPAPRPEPPVQRRESDRVSTQSAAPRVATQDNAPISQSPSVYPPIIEYSHDRSRVTQDGLVMNVNSQNRTIIISRSDYSSSKQPLPVRVLPQKRKKKDNPLPRRDLAKGPTPEPSQAAPFGPFEAMGPAMAEVPAVAEVAEAPVQIAPSKNECPTYRDTLAVRAFDGQVGPVQEIGPAETEVVSHEGPVCGNQARWVYSAVNGHWPTLSLRFPEDLQVPMLSNQALQLMAKLRGLELESGAGVVFGWLPPGYDPKISGRSEQPYFYTVDGEGLDWKTAYRRRSEQRFFILMNAEPGIHLLHLRSGKKRQDAAVAVPVQSGTATYLDLREIRRASVHGRVMDGSSPSPRVLENISVAVIGQDQLVAMTNRDGEFAFPDVILIGEHPLYIETNGAAGTTHRYRLISKDLKGLTLFRFNQEQVHAWLGQLEGGVSPESGLILAAVPETIAKETDRLLPEISQLFGSETLIPETYTLDASDRLLVEQALSPKSSRFLGVQVPSGGNLVHLLDPSRRVRWSEVVVSSPGVLTLVGPY